VAAALSHRSPKSLHSRLALALHYFTDDPGFVLLRADEFQHGVRLVRGVVMKNELMPDAPT
jgi:hypothetical protein